MKISYWNVLRKIFLPFVVVFWLCCSACSGEYCIQCVDPLGARPPVEGCDNDLNGLESAKSAYEAEGFICVIFDNP